MNGLIVAELRKIMTLKVWWALAIAPVVIGLFASAIWSAIAVGAQDSSVDVPDEFAASGLYVAIGAAILFAGLFGAVNAGSEFRYKTITTSFLTSAGRGRVILAKLIVTAIFGIFYGVLTEAVTVVSLSIFSGGAFSITGAVDRVLLAGLLAVVLWSLIGAGLGFIFGSPMWSAVILIAWFPLGELIFSAILSGLTTDSVGSILPGTVSIGVVAAGQLDNVDVLVQWPWAPILLIMWAMLFAGGGWMLTRVRDIN